MQSISVKSLISKLKLQNYNYKSSSDGAKTELAKLFIRRKLCPKCKVRIINKKNNDFRNLNLQVCSYCQNEIKVGLYRIINPPPVSRWVLTKNKDIREKLLYEIKVKTNENAYIFLRHLHITKNFTTPAIKEYLYKYYQIDINIRHLTRIMRYMGILDTHIEALRKRVVTGRMDYTKRKINYSNRKFNYVLREQRKKKNIPARQKHILVRADAELRQQIRKLSIDYKKTMSEVIRILLYAVSKVKLPKRNPTYADRLRYAIQYKLGMLKNKKFKYSRGARVSIMNAEK